MLETVHGWLMTPEFWVLTAVLPGLFLVMLFMMSRLTARYRWYRYTHRRAARHQTPVWWELGPDPSVEQLLKQRRERWVRNARRGREI